jgi:hypothetical protein
MLSNKALNLLAAAIAPKVVEHIFESDEWVTLCHEVVPGGVIKEIGEVDEDLLFELSLAVMDRIVLKAV